MDKLFCFYTRLFSFLVISRLRYLRYYLPFSLPVYFSIIFPSCLFVLCMCVFLCLFLFASISTPLSYFPFQPMLHDWCKKGRGMCYPVCGMMHIKEPVLLIGKSSPCCGSSFLSLSEWSFTICLTQYNRQ